MVRPVCLLNAVLMLPFGVAGILAPAFVFAQFGLALDAAGEAVARGYAATALGYGLILLLLRQSGGATARALMIGSFVFNVLEVLIQVPVWASGVASPLIWVTIVGHAVTASLSLVALRGR